MSNAGVSSFGLLESLTADDWDRAFAVNTRGHFLVSRAALRIMREQGRGGSIVFNASKNVTAPGREFGAYSVSKAQRLSFRSKMINPDAIFGDSRFWSDEMNTLRA